MIKLAIFAAGCFWGVEEKFLSQTGVLDTEVGYTGGIKDDPSVEDLLTRLKEEYNQAKIEFNEK